MVDQQNLKREEVTKDLKTKTKYSFINDELGFAAESREVYKKRKRIVHFPFNNRTGKPKYGKPLKITFESLNAVPAGFLKAPRTGLGFTRELFALFDRLKVAAPNLNHVVVVPEGGESKFTTTKVVLNLNQIKDIRSLIGNALDRQKRELEILAITSLLGPFRLNLKNRKLIIRQGNYVNLLRKKR